MSCLQSFWDWMTAIAKPPDDMNSKQTWIVRKIYTHIRSRNLYIAAILASMTVLQTIGLFSQSWYTLHIDLDTCVSCAPVIEAMAAILDDSMEESKLQKRLNVPVSQDDLRELYEVRESDNGSAVTVEEYVIRTSLSVHVGLWSVSVCSEGLPRCGQLGVTRASRYLESVQPYKDILSGVLQGRPFLLLAVLVSVCTTLVRSLSSRTHATGSRMTAISAGVSGFLCLVTITIVGMVHVTLMGQVPGVSPGIPWAALVTKVPGYLGLYAGYTIYRDCHSRAVYIYNWKYRRSHNYV